MLASNQDDPGKNDPRRRQWAAARDAIQHALHRWHPDRFPPIGHDWAELDTDLVEIYNVIDKWRDADVLSPYLLTLERRKGDLPTSDAHTLRSITSELLAIDFDAVMEQARTAEPTP